MALTKAAERGLDNLMGPGRTKTRQEEQEAAIATEETKLAGLELSDVQYKPLSFFRSNPENAVFDELKDKSYWEGLRRDIDEARAIVNPLVATLDGLLIEGHSRLKVAFELEAGGRGLGLLPCRLVLSPLAEDEMRSRVYLGNLSRFEISEVVRDLLYSRIWPGFYYTPPKRGRPSEIGHGDQLTTTDEISEKTGQDTRQLNRSRAYFARALEFAKEHGRGEPSIEDLQKAREEANIRRREKESKALGPAGKRITRALEKLDHLATKAESAARGGRTPDKNMAKAEGIREAIALVRTALEGGN
jgi:hypothetical protein